MDNVCNRRLFSFPAKVEMAEEQENFLSSYHAANDMQLIPIEKIFSNGDSIRKAREVF